MQRELRHDGGLDFVFAVISDKLRHLALPCDDGTYIISTHENVKRQLTLRTKKGWMYTSALKLFGFRKLLCFAKLQNERLGENVARLLGQPAQLIVYTDAGAFKAHQRP